MRLPGEVERLLLDIVADGFVVYCCGGRDRPTALAASYEWEQYVDLVTIRDFDRIIAARVPKGEDIFAPEVVVWAYEGTAECTRRALLNLVPPQHPDAPDFSYPAPPSLHVPRHEQRPMTIRFPSTDRAGVRATRLTDSWLPGTADTRTAETDQQRGQVVPG
ncbi:MAG: hypothetical protein ACRDTG_17315 [Pseudonocardiaceae bacterium]